MVEIYLYSIIFTVIIAAIIIQSTKLGWFGMENKSIIIASSKTKKRSVKQCIIAFLIPVFNLVIATFFIWILITNEKNIEKVFNK